VADDPAVDLRDQPLLRLVERVAQRAQERLSVGPVEDMEQASGRPPRDRPPVPRPNSTEPRRIGSRWAGAGAFIDTITFRAGRAVLIDIETDSTVAELTGLDRTEPGRVNRGPGPPDPGEPYWHTPSLQTFSIDILNGVPSGFASINNTIRAFFFGNVTDQTGARRAALIPPGTEVPAATGSGPRGAGFGNGG